MSQLTLEEKATLTSGDSMWSVPGLPQLGIPAMRVTDWSKWGKRADWHLSLLSLWQCIGRYLEHSTGTQHWVGIGSGNQEQRSVRAPGSHD